MTASAIEVRSVSSEGTDRLPHAPTRRERRLAGRAQRGVLGVAIALSVFGLVTAVISVATQIGHSAPGFVVWPNGVIPAIGVPGWPGTRAGVPLRAVLTAVAERPIASSDELREVVRTVPPGTPLTYTFLHDGRIVRVTVPTVLLRWRHVLPIYAGYVLDGLAFIVCGLVVYYFKPDLPATRAALAVGLSIGFDLVLALDLFSAGWLQRLCFWTESMMPGALLHFALCFPEPKRVVTRHPALIAVAYLPSVTLGFLQNLYLGSDPVAHLRVNDWVYDATAIAGLLSIGSLVHTFVSSRRVLARQQAKIVMAGVTLAAFVPSLGLLSITVLGLDLPMNLLTPFFFVYPLSIAYAIARHDLFSVDRFLRLGVVYATLSILVFVSYAGIVLITDRWTGAGRSLPPGTIPLYMIAVLLVFEPVRSRLQSLVDRLFSRQAYNYRATVEAASRALASVLDSDRIATTVLATLVDVMAIEWSVLLLVDGSGRRAYGLPHDRTAAVLHAFPDDDPALAAALVRSRPLSTFATGGTARQRRDDAIRSRFAGVGAALVVPVRFQTTPIGLLLVGEKRSGAFYTDEDLDLIETLAHQAAVALTNAGAYEVIRRTQEDLVQAERLAAVGELAAAVAHGIRNPLAGIRAAAQLAREDVAAGSDLAESLDDIVSEADRLEHRVRTILDVTRPLEPKVVDRDLVAFLDDFAAATAGRLPAGVRLQCERASEPLRARFDGIHLTEVLDTIVVNAVQAMGPGGGTITVRAQRTEGDPARPVAITVADGGPGIDAERIDQVFDLFYSTKPAGTGVGLAVARRLVERQGGTLTVASPPGRGAVFTILLAAGPSLT